MSCRPGRWKKLKIGVVLHLGELVSDPPTILILPAYKALGRMV